MTAMTNEDMQAMLKHLMEENARLKASKPQQRISFKIGEKGAVSVYGFGKFPATLYAEQWLRLMDSIDELREFIRVNAKSCKTKDGSVLVVPAKPGAKPVAAKAPVNKPRNVDAIAASMANGHSA